MKQLEPLAIKLSHHKSDTGRVKKGMGQVGRNAKADRISTKFINGGNRAMAPYDAFCRRSMCNNDVDTSPL